MNLGKETILAGIAGFALGLLAAWAVWSLPQIISKKTPPLVQEKVTPPPVAEVFDLILSQPEDEAISETDKATVSGKTQAGATVVVAGPLAEEVVEVSTDGIFSTAVSLEEGANEIVVTAYGKNDEEKTEIRTVNYSKEKF